MGAGDSTPLRPQGLSGHNPMQRSPPVNQWEEKRDYVNHHRRCDHTERQPLEKPFPSIFHCHPQEPTTRSKHISLCAEGNKTFKNGQNCLETVATLSEKFGGLRSKLFSRRAHVWMIGTGLKVLPTGQLVALVSAYLQSFPTPDRYLGSGSFIFASA
jgi:hypothetical protein